MARSSIGGTRSLIHGLLANSIYQVVTDDNRRRVQSVYEKARIVRASNTWKQAKNRLTMGTIEKAMRTFRPVVFASFEGVIAGQQSYNAFSAFNYPFVRDQVELIDEFIEEDEWLWDTYFDFQDKGTYYQCGGEYFVASGSLIAPNEFGSQVNSSGAPYYRTYIGTAMKGQTAERARFVVAGTDWDAITFVLSCDYTAKTRSSLVCVRLYRAGALKDSEIITAANADRVFRRTGDSDASVKYDEASGRLFLEWTPRAARQLQRITSYGKYIQHYRHGMMRYSDCQLQPLPVIDMRQQGWRCPADVWSTWY